MARKGGAKGKAKGDTKEKAAKTGAAEGELEEKATDGFLFAAGAAFLVVHEMQIKVARTMHC